MDTVAASYIAQGNYYASDTLFCMIHFPVTMRTEPSLTSSNATNSFTFYKASAADHMDDLSISGSANSQRALVFNQTDVSGTAAHAGSLYAAQDAILVFSAEL